LRGAHRQVVQVQHPRMDIRRFDLVVVNRHDRLTGPNVIVTRTALHRATPQRLAAAAALWAPRLAHLPRPLVAVLVGGSNGRFRLDGAVAARLAAQIGQMMALDRVGVALTPSRRTDPAARTALADALVPRGAWLWDMEGENPYFGLLGLADAIVVTMDSVSMVSEAAATAAPVMVARLPGRSRRIGLFLDGLLRDGRVRWFGGRLDQWPAAPLDDTEEAGAEMRRRLGF
jgi:mitochondrial fission protein ELM1